VGPAGHQEHPKGHQPLVVTAILSLAGTRTVWIGKAFTFEASHRLSSKSAPHRCAREYGHSYAVGVVLDSDATVPAGFVSNCGGLDVFEEYVTGTLNADLNTVLDVEPTSERIAEHLADWFIARVQPRLGDRLRSVWVSETLATWASYTPSEVTA